MFEIFYLILGELKIKLVRNEKQTQFTFQRKKFPLPNLKQIDLVSFYDPRPVGLKGSKLEPRTSRYLARPRKVRLCCPSKKNLYH